MGEKYALTYISKPENTLASSRQVEMTMTIDIEVISKQIIKPSSPTPNHLKTYNLSSIDQSSPPVPVSLAFFYSASNLENSAKLSDLKKSLSETLTQFYPLAGRIDDNETVNCNDDGVSFYEARVRSQLREVLEHVEADQLREFLPRDDFFAAGPKVLLAIQANIFDCGGMAVAVNISHKVMDASSISVLLNSWASICRESNTDENCVLPPKFDMGTAFPPKYVNIAAYPPGKPPKKMVTGRFVFSAPSIAKLRARCTNEKMIKNPSRFEAVSALVWRCAMNAARKKTGSIATKTVANIIVNMRARVDPPLSNLSVGNSVLGTMTSAPIDTESELYVLAAQLRGAVRKIDNEYVKHVQTQEGFSEFIDSFKEVDEPFTKGELEMYTFSSWMRFPFYEVDFGWGAPTWACSAGLPGKNIIALMDTKTGDGVEAWITLDEPDMAIFECEPELIAYTDHAAQKLNKLVI